MFSAHHLSGGHPVSLAADANRTFVPREYPAGGFVRRRQAAFPLLRDDAGGAGPGDGTGAAGV